MICPVCSTAMPGYSQYCSICGAPLGKQVVFSPKDSKGLTNTNDGKAVENSGKAAEGSKKEKTTTTSKQKITHERLDYVLS